MTMIIRPMTTQAMNHPKKNIEFDRLNLIGKAVYVGGATLRFVAGSIEAVVDRAVDVYIDAERAFKQGMDPNIEDAKILDERGRTDAEMPRDKRSDGST